MSITMKIDVHCDYFFSGFDQAQKLTIFVQKW